MSQPYHVLLYYCYTPIQDPQAFRKAHHPFCLEHHLRGRIIIAQEGINGTISGLAKDCQAYREHLKQDPRFASLDFKVTPHATHAFAKLHVRVKPEIVHVGLPAIDPNKEAAPYVDVPTFEKMLERDDVVIVDARSNYEHRLGTFKGAITLDINHFREFPDKVATLAPYRSKTVVTICTGGVKCEKASAYLLQQGFKDVYQLHGGIIRYGQESDGKAFEGTCYVFDNRLTTPINTQAPTVKATCHACAVACERMVNCANPCCNVHVALCKPCSERLRGACSAPCQAHPRKRPYDGTGYYVTKTNGYDPYKDAARTH